ncbi:MAG: tetraacyldisaccharide 4'-kinase [Planctomycetes bacterium RBG_13_62_9]|nr:MAG: tetraacyldisaccharide 4'-kinase [Planctomycetes bacterium RBG_13_62_9]
MPSRTAIRVFTVLSWPYSVVVRVRNHLYSTGRLKAHKVNATVLSVGNLTTGGTGKTPLAVWLCRLLRERPARCAILTRGYKMQGGELSDEPALLAAQCPDTAVIVNPDRVAGAAEAIQSHGAQVLVMDDGFQHRRLARDLDIVAIDATVPFGYGRLLPAGLLREPITSLRRAHAVVLTRCDQVSDNALQQIEETVRRMNRDLVIVRSIHAPAGLKTSDGTEIGLEEIRGKRLYAFCGIGNPRSFFRMIERLGGVPVGSKVYDDHCRYTTDDLGQIRTEAAGREAAMILTTQKDWTKTSQLAGLGGYPPLAYLAVDLQIVAGASELTALIDRVLSGRIPSL